MRRMQAVTAVVLVVIGLLSGMIPAQATAQEFTQPGDDPSTDGQTVVWVEHGVRAMRFADQHQIVVADDPSMVYASPDVSGDLVVWRQFCGAIDCPSDSVNIQAKNLKTGQTYAIGNGYNPKISGTHVLYHTDVGPSEPQVKLMVRDLSTMSNPVTIATASNDQSIVDERISGDRIAWAEIRVADKIWSIRIFTDVIGQSPVQVAEPPTLAYFGFDLSGDELVYVDNADSIAALNLSSGAKTEIPANPYDQRPSTNGRYVFWQRSDFLPDLSPNGSHIMGYDLETNSLFTVFPGTQLSVPLTLSGDLMAWQTGSSADREIHAALITSVLPTAQWSNPYSRNPNWLYFTETQHYLSFGFKDFWVQSGGVPVFGFPLTEEFSELNPDTSQMLTVQYLERQRFEYHPEHAGTPYEVELGRLGIEDARRRGLMGTGSEAFLPSTDHINGCDFAGATQHNLCGDFLAYWHSHGLNFGDAGYSDRESLALFGYPISEAYVDSQTGLLTQYFERAVFEYHPENQVPYKVLLRRLGAEQLSVRGW